MVEGAALEKQCPEQLGPRVRISPPPPRNYLNKKIVMRFVLRSKIHQATVTEANINYVGSITIDQELMDMVGLWHGEKVLVVSNTSGARLETYVMTGERNSGVICMNGAAAHQITAGEQVIIMGFELSDKPIQQKSIHVDEKNKFVKYL